MGIASAVLALSLGGALLVAELSSGADAAGPQSVPAGAPSDQATPGTSTAQTVATPSGGSLTVTRSEVASGNLRYQYSEGGQTVFGMQEAPSCAGQSRGVARIEASSSGAVEIVGTVAHGATGLTVTLGDGSTIQVPLAGVGSVEYPFFDVTLPSAPVSYQTLGVSPPAPCQAS